MDYYYSEAQTSESSLLLTSLMDYFINDIIRRGSRLEPLLLLLGWRLEPFLPTSGWPDAFLFLCMFKQCKNAYKKYHPETSQDDIFYTRIKKLQVYARIKFY
jgi:hypothetical protein